MDQSALEQIRELCSPLLSEQGAELIELVVSRERGRPCIRFLVDKPNGITLDECSELNQRISRILDAQDFIQESYVVEVSSPGLDRLLKNRRDFERSLGKQVRFVLRQPLQQQNVWVGMIAEVNAEEVVIRTQDGQNLRILQRDIARARREVDFR